MNKRYFAFSIITVVLISIAVITFSIRGISKPVVAPPTGISLIELFTSEGCSSCPKADKTVAEIQEQYKDNVLVLCYHVDYWDHLGWKDAFSSHENTERQEYYAKVLHINSTYTPQAVVNGKEEFVGSEKSNLLSAINKSSINRVSTLQLKAMQKGNNIEVNYTAGKANVNEKMVLFLVQMQATTKVGNGENGGRTLSHINIVREFVQVPKGKKHVVLTLSKGNKAEYFVAGFVQNINTGEVISIGKTYIE